MRFASGDGSSIDLNFASQYWMHEQLYGRQMSEAELIGLLGQLAVEDCVEVLSRLSCLVESGRRRDAERQRVIIRRLGFAPQITEDLLGLVSAGSDGMEKLLFSRNRSRI
jgi:hypothetical protein